MIDKLINRFFYDLPKDVKYNFRINIIAMIFAGLFSGSYGAFYGVIAREEFHAGAFWIGLIFASMSITGVLGFIAAGFVPKGHEHIWSKYIHIISSIFLILTPISKNEKEFCILLFLFHLTACYSPLVGAITGYIYPLNLRSRLLGFSKTFSSLTNMILTLLVGSVINMQIYGIKCWGIIFVISGIFHAFLGIMRSKYKLTVESEAGEKFSVFLKNSLLLLKIKHNIILIISGMVLTIGITMFSTLYPMFQVDALHINGKEVSVISVISSLSIIFTYPILGAFYSKKNPITAWFYIFPSAVILPLFYVFTVNSWYPLILGSMLNTFFAVTYDLAWLNLVIYLGGNNKIKDYQAFYALIMGIRAVIGLLISSWIINYCEHLSFGVSFNLKIGFIIGIVFIFISFLITLPLLSMKNKQS